MGALFNSPKTEVGSDRRESRTDSWWAGCWSERSDDPVPSESGSSFYSDRQRVQSLNPSTSPLGLCPLSKGFSSDSGLRSLPDLLHSSEFENNPQFTISTGKIEKEIITLGTKFKTCLLPIYLSIFDVIINPKAA